MLAGILKLANCSHKFKIDDAGAFQNNDNSGVSGRASLKLTPIVFVSQIVLVNLRFKTSVGDF